MLDINPFLLAITIFIVLVMIIILIYFFLLRKDPETTSGTGNVITCTQAPSQPTNVVAEYTNADIIAVAWDPVSSAESYRIYISKVSGFFIRDALQVKSTTLTNISFGNLETGYTYYIRVTAYSSCGESEASIQTEATIPYFWPDQFKITNTDDSTIDVSYSPPNPNAIAEQNCDLISGVNCYFQYVDSDKTIRLASDPTKCLVSNFGSPEINTCVSVILPARQWTYDPSNPSLCITDQPNLCLKTIDTFNNPLDFGTNLELGPLATTFVSKWDIVEV